MSQAFIGEIRLVGFSFNPLDWQICDGSLLPISDYAALYTLIGTTYGGDGTSTFAVPDLRGRVPIHQGMSPGLSTYAIGQQGGQTEVTLSTSQLPSHTHAVSASSTGNASSPTGNYFGPTAVEVMTATGSPLSMGSTVSQSGGGLPHENRQPFLVMNYVIALFGVYPSSS